MSNQYTALYKSILRAHRKYLPEDMKTLGNTYVKAEFKLHKGTTKPEQLTSFYIEWEKYLEQITMTARAQDLSRSGLLDQEILSSSTEEATTKSTPKVLLFGKDLPPDTELTDEQSKQLERLRQEALKVRDPRR